MLQVPSLALWKQGIWGSASTLIMPEPETHLRWKWKATKFAPDASSLHKDGG